MRILITGGGTRVPIDSVRYIGNMSTGRFPAKLVEVFTEKGHNVTYLMAKDSVWPSWIKGQCFQYNDYNDYLEQAVALASQDFDIIISAAAVSDYIVENPVNGKIQSENEITIKLVKAKKVLPLIRAAAKDSLLVGFKLLVSPTDEQKSTAINKVFDNGADVVIYNDLTELRNGNSRRFLYSSDKKLNAITDVNDLIVDWIVAQRK
jgi:phosphopantothenoylcysteine decarboxylase/phosphopantothenate--cysteine ligase